MGTDGTDRIIAGRRILHDLAAVDDSWGPRYAARGLGDRAEELWVFSGELAGPGMDRTVFRRELNQTLEKLALIPHPNIATVYDRGVVDEHLWVSAEHVVPNTLASQPVQQLPVSAVAEIVAQVAQGLDHAHSWGLVHGHVSWLSVSDGAGADGGVGRVVLTGFGVRPAEARASSAGWLNPSTAAPELFDDYGRETFSPHTDRYALAVLAYVMLTAQYPFSRGEDTEERHRVRAAGPASVLNHRAGLAPSVDGVLRRGMANLPDERFLSGREFAAALADALGVSTYSAVSSLPATTPDAGQPVVPLAPIKAAPEPPAPKAAVDLSDPQRLNKILDKLDALPGMEDVAGQVRRMAQRALRDVQRKEQGLPVAEAGYHALFIGPAGTGKTTVARVWGEMLAAIGVLPSGHVVEARRSDLVAPYLGQTAPKTIAKIDEAEGGVLFIDEAYSLTPETSTGDQFGAEAVEALLKEMEDRRGRFVVIAAGYEREMERFLESNSGLASRFARTIDFRGYDAATCVRILDAMTTESGYRLTASARDITEKVLNKVAGRTPKNWGNARSIRQLLDAAVEAQAMRLPTRPTADELATLTDADLLRAIDHHWPEYVADRRADRGFVNTVCATIGVGTDPNTVAVAPDGDRVYVTNYTSNTVSVIDARSNKVVDTIAVASPYGIVLGANGSTAYITNSKDDRVSVIDTGTGTVITTATTGRNPQCVAIAPGAAAVYIANWDDNSVSVIDTSTNTLAATIPVGENPQFITADPNGAVVWVSNTSSGSLSKIDTATRTVTATVPVGGWPRQAVVAPDGTAVYVVDERRAAIRQVDLMVNTPRIEVPVRPTPFGAALTPDGATLYVTNLGTNDVPGQSVSVIDTASGTVTATIDTGQRPKSVALSADGRTAYVVNQWSASVSVIVLK